MLDILTRIPGFRRLWSKFPIGSVPLRTEYDVWSRPHYAYGVYSAVDLAKRLGLASISVIEFGVAGGRGLLALEEIAKKTAEHFNINVDCYGFDSGTGMPEAVDYRDLPHVWQQGFYQMDVEHLRSRLRSARLILCPVDKPHLFF